LSVEIRSSGEKRSELYEPEYISQLPSSVALFARRDELT